MSKEKSVENKNFKATGLWTCDIDCECDENESWTETFSIHDF